MATIDSMNRDTTRLSDGPDWTFELLETYLAEVDRVAKLYRLDTYPHQIEVITSEQMMDAYSSVGMPINYPHWSFGKKFIETEQAYKHGQQGLAYEIVINSNPCIAYLMEENTITMQALVMAHACYGHNSFFKNNYLFRSWTDASSIIDYLIFARKYITDCEERYGVDEVEAPRFLSCPDELRRRSLQTPAKNLVAGGESAAEKPGRVSAKPGEYAMAHPAEAGRREDH